ncbi:di-trans,poly-cis-decaprenylcistransferase [Candidatus Micrarchaeota archaeon RBG_16_49_10]|nr:MAG: di-trans,poly-cis-decaprenylcistransferase [Candidatus Micrarchaeota archaeon RBG_16_49_10]
MNILKHIALAPDGNRRWARKNGKTVVEGHAAGAENISKFIKNCFNLGIPQVTVWLMSTENLNRPKEELDALFKLAEYHFDRLFKEMDRDYKARVRFYGELERLPKKIREKMKTVEKRSNKYTDRKVNVLIAYGGRHEISEAFNKILKKGLKKVDETTIKDNLFVTDDVDLVIRAGAMKRLSGFLPFQTVYSELYFTDTLWPDFGKEELLKAVKWFEDMKRNFGK